MIETLLRRRGNSSAKRRPRGPAQPEAGVILAALAFPVIVIDRAGQIRFVNPAAEQFLGSGATGPEAPGKRPSGRRDRQSQR